MIGWLDLFPELVSSLSTIYLLWGFGLFKQRDHEVAFAGFENCGDERDAFPMDSRISHHQDLPL